MALRLYQEMIVRCCFCYDVISADLSFQLAGALKIQLKLLNNEELQLPLKLR
jgi:hypothetical protein